MTGRRSLGGDAACVATALPSVRSASVRRAGPSMRRWSAERARPGEITGMTATGCPARGRIRRLPEPGHGRGAGAGDDVAAMTEPVRPWVRQQSGSGEGSEQGQARSRRRAAGGDEHQGAGVQPSCAGRRRRVVQGLGRRVARDIHGMILGDMVGAARSCLLHDVVNVHGVQRPLMRPMESYPAHMTDSPWSPEEIRAAAEVHRELGPEYSDAVVASFLEKVDREIAVRVEARLAGTPRTEPAKAGSRRALLTGMAIGAAVGGIPLLLLLVTQARHVSQAAVPGPAGGNVTQVVSHGSESFGWLLLLLIVVAICAVAAVLVRQKQRGAEPL